MKMKNKNSKKAHSLILAGLLIAASFLPAGINAQIVWPEGQLLPSFPASAQTQDLILMNGSITAEELYLFSSLKGLINRTQPRIFSYEGDDFAEGRYTWLQSLNVGYVERQRWTVLNKYKDDIAGLIVYDTAQVHTVNLAARLAKEYNALVASPALLERLTVSPYHFPILLDLRANQFANKLEIYQYLFDNYWENTDKRLLIGLSPDHHKGSLREYAVALGAAVVWLDPKVNAESTLLNKFLASMPAGANYMGWWPEEQDGVMRVSQYGFTTIASDYSTNLTFHSGMPRTIDARPMPAKPALENKMYVAFILSDGDNLQYVEHLMRKLWNNADRGKVPIGWTLSPAMVDAMPGALNYYHQSSTDNDNLISGPSGYGYTYPNYWNSRTLDDALANFVAKTEEYNVKAGIRVITVWNTIQYGIYDAPGKVYADNSTTLLGVTAQNTGGALKIYSAKLPNKPLSCNYCNGEQSMIDHIASAANGWNGREPRFIIIQAAPWNNVTPTTFKNVAATLGSDYVVVRPDHIFQLIREANNLPINPGGVEGDGDGLIATYFNGKDFNTEIVNRIDTCVNFDWGTGAPTEGVDSDNFSVRWTGKVMPRYSGTCTFYLTVDNNARLYVNNELIIDRWTSGSNAVQTGKIQLTAGEKYDLKLEYYDQRAAASCKLEWASPFHSREVVPKSHLFQAAPSGICPTDAAQEPTVYLNRSGKGLIDVEAAGRDHLAITVYDVCGKTCLKQSGRALQQIDLRPLAKGIYLIAIQSGTYAKTVRYILE
jgi:hypothetical protein